MSEPSRFIDCGTESELRTVFVAIRIISVLSLFNLRRYVRFARLSLHLLCCIKKKICLRNLARIIEDRTKLHLPLSETEVFGCLRRISNEKCRADINVTKRHTDTTTKAWIANGNSPGMRVNARMFLWRSLCTVYLLAWQMAVTTDDASLCCCVHVTSFDR